MSEATGGIRLWTVLKSAWRWFHEIDLVQQPVWVCESLVASGCYCDESGYDRSVVVDLSGDRIHQQFGPVYAPAVIFVTAAIDVRNGRSRDLAESSDAGSQWGNLRQQRACPANTWMHVAMAYDGTTIQFSVNGAAAGSAAASIDDYNLNAYPWETFSVGCWTKSRYIIGRFRRQRWCRRCRRLR